jgi:hypothetical protein
MATTRATAAVLASAASAADALIDSRIAPSTRRSYMGNINRMQKFWIENMRCPFDVPVQLGDILAFFGWLIDVHFKEKEASFQTIRQYKSALKWHYAEKKLVMQPDVNQGIETLLKGYERMLATLRLEGKRKAFEGKLHLTFAGYCSLAQASFNTKPFAQMLFAWPYLVMQWNLMARAASVSSLMMEHVAWEGDALLISLPKHKGDQEGVKNYARHLYANVLNPFICPVLALAVLIFTYVLKHDPDAAMGSDAVPSYRIFDGSDNESRFSAILKRRIKSLSEAEMRTLGGTITEIGTHSVRKGAASYCAGMINGPSPLQICLRGGWHIGGVLDRYLFPGAGGDQLTGRVLSGLPFNESTFASLPPHFDAAGAAGIAWSTVLPLYSTLPATFKRAVPYLLASICYHEHWLKSNLAEGHPLFSTYLFTSGAVNYLKSRVLTGCNRCTATPMIATGIPPHLAMTNELTAVVRQTEALKTVLLSKCDELPTQLVDKLLSKFTINGAIPVTMDDFKTLLTAAVNEMRAEVRDALPDRVRASAPQAHADASGDSRFQLWMWGGKLRPVPEGWQLPSTDAMATWRLWYFGNVSERIRPLRHLHKSDLVSKDVSRWSKTHTVMEEITRTMVDLKVVTREDDVGQLSEEAASAAFTQSIAALMERVRPGATRKRGRWTQMAPGTLYKYVNETNKRRRLEAPAAEGQQAAAAAAAEDDADEAAGEAEAAADSAE